MDKGNNPLTQAQTVRLECVKLCAQTMPTKDAPTIIGKATELATYVLQGAQGKPEKSESGAPTA